MKIIYVFLLNIIICATIYAQTTALSLAPHYLYQFANHIKQPQENSIYHIHIISENSKIKQNFEKVLNDKKIRGKDFFITQSDKLRVPNSTDAIYMSPDSKVKFSELSAYVEGKSILLVSSNEKDKKIVMINLFETSDNRLAFEINRANILNEGFSISDKVVLMGGTELDVAKLFKGAKQSLHEKELVLKKNELALQESKLAFKKSELALKGSNEKLNKAKEKVANYLSDINKAKESIAKINEAMAKEKKAYKQQTIKNKTLQKSVLENRNINIKIKKDLDDMLALIKKKDDYILKREVALKALNQSILEKEKELNELSKISKSQGKQISIQEDTIDTQQDFLMWVLIALGLFMILVTSVIFMLRRQNKISEELKTTLEKLEETQGELVQSAKMASLGELVSGLAHEMNTPIGTSVTGISILQNESNTLKQKLEDKDLKESDLVSYLDTVGTLVVSLNISLQKAAQLVRSFKQVSVDQQVEVLREFNLSEYLNTILVSFKSQFKHKNIKLHLDVDSSISLNSYPGIYYQVIANLMNNSLLHAFEDIQDGDIWISAKIDGDMLYIVYKDSGVGVNKENLSRIFDPFFTTKRAQGGTGLGLHIIYNLITQKLHGSIKATSNKGEGLILSMKLPLIVNAF